MITKKTKIFASFSVITFCIAGVILFLVFTYVYKQGEELILQAKEVADYTAREQSYRELSQLVENTKEERNELTNFILTKDNTINFLAMIEAVALEQDVELTTNALQVHEGDGVFDSLVISFDVEGVKSHVYALLKILETLPYQAFVSQVSFQSPVDSQTETIKGTIELTTSLFKT